MMCGLAEHETEKKKMQRQLTVCVHVTYHSLQGWSRGRTRGILPPGTAEGPEQSTGCGTEGKKNTEEHHKSGTLTRSRTPQRNIRTPWNFNKGRITEYGVRYCAQEHTGT